VPHRARLQPPPCFRDYRPLLAPGERGTVMLLAADRRQARTVFRDIRGREPNIAALAHSTPPTNAKGVVLAACVSWLALVGIAAQEPVDRPTWAGSTVPPISTFRIRFRRTPSSVPTRDIGQVMDGR
jgi:hypothetical protein